MNEFIDSGNPFTSFPFPLVSCLFLCRKLHLFVGKSTKKLLPPELLFFGTNTYQIVCRLTALAAPPDHLVVFRDLLLRGRVGEGREFLLCPRKKKKSAPMAALVI